MLDSIFLAIIPVFVAIDIIGIIPVYLSLTEHTPPTQRLRVLRQSVFTALLVSLLFLVLGNVVFSFLGITMSDFKIAGGIILFAIAINDLLFSTEERKSHEVESDAVGDTTIGIVPIGIPLIVGPALLTTILISLDANGLIPTVLAVVINLVIVYVGLRYSAWLLRLVGKSGAKGIAKVVTLLLAAIGVMMVRTGIIEIMEKMQ